MEFLFRHSFEVLDRARDPLFVFVSEEALRRPTYKAFISLLDNYETSTGKFNTRKHLRIQNTASSMSSQAHTEIIEQHHQAVVLA